MGTNSLVHPNTENKFFFKKVQYYIQGCSSNSLMRKARAARLFSPKFSCETNSKISNSKFADSLCALRLAFQTTPKDQTPHLPSLKKHNPCQTKSNISHRRFKHNQRFKTNYRVSRGSTLSEVDKRTHPTATINPARLSKFQIPNSLQYKYPKSPLCLTHQIISNISSSSKLKISQSFLRKCQDEERAVRVWAKGEPSDIVRSSEITSRASPSLRFVVWLAEVV